MQFSCADLLEYDSEHNDVWVILGVSRTFYAAEFPASTFKRSLFTIDIHFWDAIVLNLRRVGVVWKILKRESLVIWQVGFSDLPCYLLKIFNFTEEEFERT